MLHALRCLGFVDASRITAATGLDLSEVDDELIRLGTAGLVAHETGTFGGWGLTETGRAADAERTAEELTTSGARAAVSSAFDDFLVLNPELLEICTAWLLRPDTTVLNLLTDFDRRADAVLEALSSALPRFARYRVRLTDALTRALAGEHAYVSENLDSYHVVWFQLHEDLLVTLGIPRH